LPIQEPQVPDQRETSRNTWPIAVCVWAVLTLGSSAAYLADVDSLRALSNAFQVLTLPGWIVLRVIHWLIRVDPTVAAIASNGIGWAFWFAVASLILRARRGFLPATAALTAETQRPVNSSRRQLLFDAPMSLALMGGAGAVIEGAGREPWTITEPGYKVAIKDLPPALDGLRIVQLSDTHLGPRVPASYLQKVIARAVELNPDLFLLTGDYIHNGTRHITAAAELFQPLVATGRPVVAVLGNHDWYGSGAKMAAALTRVGITMVDNARTYLTPTRTLTDSATGAALCVAGLGDLMEDSIRVSKALDGVPAAMPRIVLAHNPDTAELPQLHPSRGPRIDLMLSGHTHGGQIAAPFVGPLIIPSAYGHKYAGGLANAPGFPVIVSRGIGMSLIPVRLGVPPELVQVTLTRA
jgi:uncharacterized protein